MPLFKRNLARQVVVLKFAKPFYLESALPLQVSCSKIYYL